MSSTFGCARESGEALSLPRLWALSKAWESNKLDPDWQPRSIPEWQAILDGLGLTSALWQIPTS